MKHYLFVPLISALSLAASPPVIAEAALRSDQTASVRIATASDPAANRDSYLQRARTEMADWHLKLDDFGSKIATKSSAIKASAMKKLDAAWSDTKLASSQLEAAGADEWTRARASFERASHALAVEWHKAVPASK